ncbi:MAG: CRISPR-associated endonuclease Cas1 [Nitrospirota bacterium]
MDKTLYLNENKDIRVVRDGPSLWVCEDGKAGRRIPARIISRVVIIGNFVLEAGVITLFTENDIPVTFFNKRGNEMAVAIPYNHNNFRHNKWQKLFLINEENIIRFKNWAISKKRELQLNTIRRFSKRIAELYTREGFKDKDYQKIINRNKKTEKECWEIVYNMINGLFREMVIACLISANLDPHIGIFYRRANFGLALDICHILIPENDIQTIQFFNTKTWKENIIQKGNNWYLTKEGIRDIIIRFENRKKYMQEMVERFIDDIFEIMRELRK